MALPHARIAEIKRDDIRTQLTEERRRLVAERGEQLVQLTGAQFAHVVTESFARHGSRRPQALDVDVS